MEDRTIIIGAGLTGLATAFFMQKKGIKVLLLEKNDRIGGAMHSHSEDGFVYEEGPNTGVVSTPEVTELFEYLGIQPELANKDAEKRLILKHDNWHPLPNGAVGFFKTPLFSFSDKIKIAFEPFRKKGNNPHESVASLATRRIGKSFVDYAVNPFISGIYAGDPDLLVTKYALPKLYALEQNYGSFIGGTIKKSREPKTERDKKATRKVFSVNGGFSTLINKLKEEIGEENIVCNAKNIEVNKDDNNKYRITYTIDSESITIPANKIVSTIGAYALPDTFPFLEKRDLHKITELRHAKVIQIAVAIDRNAVADEYFSFGGLIPQKENKRILGVLFPSFCFANRAPEGYTTLAVYMGGMRHPEYISLSDTELENIVSEELEKLLQIPKSAVKFMKIYRHTHAIPQYEVSSGERFEAVRKIESENKGLIIAGNLRDGIGIADRIKQAYNIAEGSKF